MLVFAHNRCKRLSNILASVFCKSSLPDLHHIRLHNPVPVLSGYGRHRLSDIIRSTLTAMITLNDKRLWIIQNEFYKSSGYPVHRLLCQWSYRPDAVFLLDFFRSIKDARTRSAEINLCICSNIRFFQSCLYLFTVCRCVCRLWPDDRLAVTPGDHEKSLSHGRCSVVSGNQLPELHFVS